MSSTLVVPVVELLNVRTHPRADALELCEVLGYQMVIPKGQFKTGDKMVYFPSGTIIPVEWADKFGIRKFLKGVNNDIVHCVRLRGEPSFGLVVPTPEGTNWDIGTNVADYYGASKYIPPVKIGAEDAAAYDDEIDPFVQRYTDIENGRIFVDIFKQNEEVSVTEKLHGTNAKVGIINGYEIAGSMGVRRKKPVDNKPSLYWMPWSVPGVREMIESFIQMGHKQVLVYGEIIGSKIQNLNYGYLNGTIGFRAFDILVDGSYLNHNDFMETCGKFNVTTVPLLYRGPFDMGSILKMADGTSTIGDHIREGIVVKPIIESTDPKIGRRVLKFIGTEYELSKKDDSTDR